MTGAEIAALAVSSIQASLEQLKVVLDVLTAGRSVLVEIDNNTPLTLKVVADHHDHGALSLFLFSLPASSI